MIYQKRQIIVGSDSKERRSCNFRVNEECPLKRARNDAAYENKLINGCKTKYYIGVDGKDAFTTVIENAKDSSTFYFTISTTLAVE